MDQPKKLSKEERIAMRTARINAKRSTSDQQKKGGSASSGGSSSHSAAKQRIGAARAALDEVKHSAESAVDKIIADREITESERRQREHELSQSRSGRISAELAESRRLNEEIEKKWLSAIEKKIPQELFAEIAAQYRQANELLQGKDSVIHSLERDLKAKDEEYVEMLNQWEKDLFLMISTMHQGFKRYYESIRKELSEIEGSFLAERSELLQRNQEALNQLFERRRKMELSIMEAKIAREKKYSAELEEIRMRDAEDYNALKIELENSIQVFEQQLEQMKATYQLNAEKLEYNHSVLMERDLENKSTVEHHRQKLRKLKESLVQLTHKFRVQEEAFQKENQQLTAEFQRSTDQFKDLQKKFIHFIDQDTSKYDAVWEMNEERVMFVVRKLLKAEAIIDQQVLGRPWRLQQYFTDVQAAEEIDFDRIQAEMIIQRKYYLQKDKGANNAKKEARMESQEEKAEEQNTATAARGSKFTPQQIRAALQLIANEASYLIDSRTLEMIEAVQARARESEKDLSNPDAIAEGQNSAPPSELILFQSDGVLSSLGVESMEDLESLIAPFYSDNAEAEAPTVHPNDVNKVLKQFIVNRNSAANNSNNGGNKGKEEKKEKKDKSATKESAGKKSAKQDDAAFWTRLSEELMGPERLDQWEALYEWEKKYLALLENRAELIDETNQLAEQNEQLKQLLQQYLTSEENTKYIIPPTQLIRVRK